MVLFRLLVHFSIVLLFPFFSLWRIQDFANNAGACLECCDRELHPVLRGIVYDEVFTPLEGQREESQTHN